MVCYKYINMKLYLNGILNNNINKELLKDYALNTKKKQLIFSHQGILEITENEMHLLKIKDSPSEPIMIDKFRGFIDKSEYIQDEDWYQVPQAHIMEVIIINTYELRPKALLQLVIEERKNVIIDFYFIIKGSMKSLGIKDDILTFLSILKLC